MVILTVTDPLSCFPRASMNGNEEALKLVVEVGGDALMKNDDGLACVHIASVYGHVDALRMLMEVGGKELVMSATNDGHVCARGF